MAKYFDVYDLQFAGHETTSRQPCDTDWTCGWQGSVQQLAPKIAPIWRTYGGHQVPRVLWISPMPSGWRYFNSLFVFTVLFFVFTVLFLRLHFFFFSDSGRTPVTCFLPTHSWKMSSKALAIEAPTALKIRAQRSAVMQLWVPIFFVGVFTQGPLFRQLCEPFCMVFLVAQFACSDQDFMFDHPHLHNRMKWQR